MNAASADSLYSELRAVDAERARRAADSELSGAVRRLKAYQQHRFVGTYADLLNAPRYAAATRFFLEELYGPGDFSRRDAQFARVVPGLIRLFPADTVGTVDKLVRLHAMSERLDTRMAELLGPAHVDASSYAQAWRACGERDQRQQQIELTVAVGSALDRLTRKQVLRHSLRLMRRPAQLAGMADLQSFLERGFDTFKAMGGADEFLAIVRAREEAFAQALFRPDRPGQLGQLP